MNSNTIIFTGPIRSGKTTALFELCSSLNNCGGFLTPDREGRRYLYDIDTQKWIDFELRPEDNEPNITIGKFRFKESTIEHGNNLIMNALDKEYNYFIIDELGKLEMNNQGFAEAFSRIYADYKNKIRFILVIRDTLLANAMEVFNLHDAIIINNDTEYLKDILMLGR